MYKIKVKAKNIDVTFSGLVFNNDEELEFTKVDVEFLNQFKFIFNEEEGKLELIGGSNITLLISLEDEQIQELQRIKQETRDYIINLYMGLLKGDEEFLFLDIGTKDFPYIITSQAILDAKVTSPKYDNALQYVFSDKVLKANNKRINFKFNSYEEFQRELGQEIKKRKLKSNIELEGQKALKLKWHDIVS